MYLLRRQYRPIKVEHVSTLCYRGTFRFVNHFKLNSVFVLRSNIKLNNSIKRCIYYIRSIYYHWWKIFYSREQNIVEYCFHELSVSRRFPPILTFFSLNYDFYPWFSSLFKKILFLFPGSRNRDGYCLPQLEITIKMNSTKILVLGNNKAQTH